MSDENPQPAPRQSALFDNHTLSQIRRAAATGIYDITIFRPVGESFGIGMGVAGYPPFQLTRVTRRGAVALTANVGI